MPHRIEVAFKEEIRDPLGEKTAARIKHDLGLAAQSVRTIEVYAVDAPSTRRSSSPWPERPIPIPSRRSGP